MLRAVTQGQGMGCGAGLQAIHIWSMEERGSLLGGSEDSTPTNPQDEGNVKSTIDADSKAALRDAVTFDAQYLTALIARTITQPMEVLRLQAQVGRRVGGAHAWAERMLETSGSVELMKGHSLMCIRTSWALTIHPLLAAFSSRLVPDIPSLLSRESQAVMADILGSTLGLLIDHPLLVLKTRMTVQSATRPHYTSLAQGLSTIGREDGLAALYRGFTPLALGVIPHYLATAGGHLLLSYYFQDYQQHHHHGHRGKGGKKKKGILSRLKPLAALVVGMAANFVTYPIATVTARLHMQSDVWAEGIRVTQYNGAIDCFQSIVRHEGWSALWSGFVGEAVKGVPFAAISFLVFNGIESITMPNGRKKQSTGTSILAKTIRTLSVTARIATVGYVLLCGVATIAVVNGYHPEEVYNYAVEQPRRLLKQWQDWADAMVASSPSLG